MAGDLWDRAAAAATLRPGADPFENAVIGGSRPSTRQAQDIGDALKAGWQSSSMGLLLRGKMPDTEVGPDSPWYIRAASGVGNVAGDFIPGAVGAVGGAITGTAAGGPIGSAVGGAAGGFGVPMALRDALIAAYSTNSALSWEGVKEIGFAALKGGTKGAIVGAATGGAGAYAARAAGAVIAPSVGVAMTGQTAARVIEGTALATELTTMTTGMAALDGRMPTYQDFLDNAILLGGLKAATATAKGMMNVFSQTGKTPAEQVLDAQADPRIKEALTRGDGKLVKMAEDLAGDGMNSAGGRQKLAMAQAAVQDGSYIGATLKDGERIRLVNLDAGAAREIIALDMNGNRVGGLQYLTVEHSPGVRFNPDVYVSEGWRRKGVASAMYDLAERTGGLIPDVAQEGQVRTELGQAFREARARGVRTSTVDTPLTLPEPYRQLALEERVKAALDTDQKPQLAAALAAEAMGKPQADAPQKMVRYEYITDRETFDTVVRSVVETYGEQIERQRREIVPTRQSIAEGAIMAASGDTTGAPKAYSAPEAAARAFLLRGAAERAKELTKQLDATPIEARSIEQQLGVYAAFEQVGMFYGELAAGVAEAARTLQLMGQIKRNPELIGDARMLLDAYNRSGKDLGSLTGMLKSMNDPAQMAKFASELQKATTLEKVIEVYRANLFSGFMTHLANPIGNMTKWVVDLPESMATAGLEALRRSGTNDPMTMAQFKARAFAPVIGLQLGGMDGVKAAAEVFTRKTEVLDKAEQVRVSNEGALGTYTGTVFRALQAEDMLFRVPAERAKAYIMAVDRAVKEGFNPNTTEGQQAIMRYTNQPQYGLTLEAAQKVTAAIQQAGAEAVFAQDLGPRLLKVQQAIAGSPVQFLLPAFRTPANLLSWSVQRIPGLNLLSGRWRDDFNAGGERRSQAMARLAIGTSIAITAYSLAEAGLITGSGIYDKEQAGTKRGAGWQPNSLKIGGEYYSFERIEPVAKILTMAADMIELMKVSKDEEDKAKIGMMLIAGFGNATVSTTYLSGLANAIKAVTDPDRNATNFFEGYAAGLVPKAVGQVVTASDPYKREVDGVLDAIQSQLPFVREKLLPKRSVWGEPMQNDRFFDVLPVATSKQSEDKVKTEAMRLQLAIVDAPRELVEKGPFKQKERDIKLTGEMRDVMREVSGKMALEILSPIVNAPDWDRIPDFAKAEVYKRVVERSRQQGALQALPPDSPERVQMRDKIVNKINEQFRAAEAR